MYAVYGSSFRALMASVCEEGDMQCWWSRRHANTSTVGGPGGGWHEAMVLICLPLAAPIGLSLWHIPTPYGSEGVLVVSTAPLAEGGKNCGLGGSNPIAKNCGKIAEKLRKIAENCGKIAEKLRCRKRPS